MRISRLSILAPAMLAITLAGCGETAAPRSGGISSIRIDPNLQPAERLRYDTVEAATHDHINDPVAYVGVWAATADGCGKIDIEPYDGFAVIAPSSIRQFEELCSYTRRSASGNRYEFDAFCSAESGDTTRVISIEIRGNDQLRLKNSPGARAIDMYRCRLTR